MVMHLLKSEIYLNFFLYVHAIIMPQRRIAGMHKHRASDNQPAKLRTATPDVRMELSSCHPSVD